MFITKYGITVTSGKVEYSLSDPTLIPTLTL